MHGKTCEVIHEEDELFEGIPSPVTGMRYHSLVVEPRSLPKDLVITAWSADRPKDGEIMAMKHRRHPIYGVQYHGIDRHLAREAAAREFPAHRARHGVVV